MKAAPEDDRIITNAMLREQDQERIELLEGLLIQMSNCIARGVTIKPDSILALQIRAALEGK
jgi:hypothetical protein